MTTESQTKTFLHFGMRNGLTGVELGQARFDLREKDQSFDCVIERRVSR